MASKKEVLAQIDVVSKTISEKQQDLNCNRITLKNKDNEIETLNSQQADKQKSIDEALAKVEI